MNRNTNRGFTLVELLVVMAIIAILLGLLLPVLNEARASTKQKKDAAQIKQVHTGWLTVASDDPRGNFPLPGEIDRLAVNGTEIPGRGNIDETQNSHRFLYSWMLGQNILPAEMLISTAEGSGRVVACLNYDFNAYNPQADNYWDATNFQANLDGTCNTSYGTMPLENTTRRTREWKQSLNSKFAIMGNRGVEGGVIADMATSKTAEIHGASKQWEGNICFNDNHMVYVDTFTPEGMATVGTGASAIFDNLFKRDGTDASDCYLNITSAAPTPLLHTESWD